MLMGAPGKERITCVHEELFLRSCDREVKTVADMAHLLPEVRRMVEGGRLEEIRTEIVPQARRQLMAMGCRIWPVMPHPAFDIVPAVACHGAATAYHRQLDLETGEALTRWKDSQGVVEQRLFSSRTHNVNVVALRGVEGRKLTATLCLRETPGREGRHSGFELDDVFKTVQSSVEPGWLMYHASYAADHGGYEGLARVTVDGGKMSVAGNRLEIVDADAILVVCRTTPLADGASSRRASVQDELAGLSCSYPDLLTPHARCHGEMFRRMTLDLGCAAEWLETTTEAVLARTHEEGISPLFLEQMHAMGRYLLISSCGKYPPPLQGIWGASWRPDWSGGFVLDSNLNLAISAASMSNLPECAESYFGYVERILPGWRLNAKKYLGCRGFLVPHYADPEKGYLAHFTGTYAWMYWPGGGGWNIRPFYDHALLTGGTEFMRTRVYPLYREMAEFYEDYLVRDDDGRYHITPGISPENWPSNMEKGLTLKDCSFDLAVAREVFDILLDLGEQFDATAGELGKWRERRDHLLDYRINEDGALAEWVPEAYADNYKHRHSSHLYPVYPGTEFLEPDTDPALLRAAGVALDKRFEEDTVQAHGLIHVALMATRLHDVEKVRTNLDRFSRRHYVYDGMVTSHDPDQSKYNLDASLSLPRLLMEMLVFSRPGYIELLPAWPADYPDGTLKGVLVRGGHTMDIIWKEGKLESAVLHAGCSDNCTIAYRDVAQSFDLEEGQAIVFRHEGVTHDQ